MAHIGTSQSAISGDGYGSHSENFLQYGRNTTSTVWPASQLSTPFHPVPVGQLRQMVKTLRISRKRTPSVMGGSLSKVSDWSTQVIHFYLLFVDAPPWDGRRSSLSLDIRNVIYSVYDLLGSRWISWICVLEASLCPTEYKKPNSATRNPAIEEPGLKRSH